TSVLNQWDFALWARRPSSPTPVSISNHFSTRTGSALNARRRERHTACRLPRHARTAGGTRQLVPSHWVPANMLTATTARPCTHTPCGYNGIVEQLDI